MEAASLHQPAAGRRAPGATLLRLRSDAQLVELFRQGNDEAFRAIHDRYRARLLAYTRQMLPGLRPDAEDVLQDVFLRAYAALRADDRPVTLRAWLYRVAHNRCVDQVRRPGSPLPPVELPEHVRAASDPPADAERREDLRRLVEDVGRLPDQQRSALLMRELEGLTYAELADALNTSVPAVKSLLVRARMGLTDARTARDTSCLEIRRDLMGAHDRGVRASGRSRRHLRGCAGCRDFRAALKGLRAELAALGPALGPWGMWAKALALWGAGGGAAVGSGVAAGGGAAGAGALGAGAAVGSGAVLGGGATAGGGAALAAGGGAAAAAGGGAAAASSAAAAAAGGGAAVAGGGAAVAGGGAAAAAGSALAGGGLGVAGKVAAVVCSAAVVGGGAMEASRPDPGARAPRAASAEAPRRAGPTVTVRPPATLPAHLVDGPGAQAPAPARTSSPSRAASAGAAAGAPAGASAAPVAASAPPAAADPGASGALTAPTEAETTATAAGGVLAPDEPAAPADAAGTPAGAGAAASTPTPAPGPAPGATPAEASAPAARTGSGAPAAVPATAGPAASPATASDPPASPSASSASAGSASAGSASPTSPGGAPAAPTSGPVAPPGG